MGKLPLIKRLKGLVASSSKREKEPVQSREERFHEAVDDGPIGLGLASPNGQWLHVNDRLAALAGYTREELARISFHHITHADDARREAPLLKRLIDGHLDSYRIQKRVIDKRGNYQPLDVTVAVARGVRGLAEFLLYVVTTEGERHAEAAKSEDRGQEVLDGFDRLREVGIIRTDERGLITGWNRGALQIFGYSSEEAVGRQRRSMQKIPAPPEAPPLRAGEEWRATREGQPVAVRSWFHEFLLDGERKLGIEIVVPASESGGALTEAEAARLRSEVEKERRTNDSLRHALQDLRRVGEETMNELKVVTLALRKEIDKRQELEEQLRKADALLMEAAAETAEAKKKSDVDHEIVTAGERTWQPLNPGGVVEIIRGIARDRRTGTLVVESGSRVKELFFSDGRLFSCSSNDPADFLAERLIARGYLTEEQRQRAVEIRQHTQLALGRLLLILGAISEAQLVEVMREKAADQIVDLATWREGRWTFAAGPIPSLQLVPLNVDPGEIFDALRPAPMPSDAEFEEVFVFEPAPPPRVEEAASEPEPEPAATAVAVEEPREPEERFVASSNAKKYHRPSCKTAKKIAVLQRLEITAGEAASRGLERCRLCFR